MARNRSAPAPSRSASSAASRPRPAASSSPSPAAPARPSTPPPATPSYSAPQPHAPQHHAPTPAPMASSSMPPAMQSSGGGGGIFSGIMGSVVTGAAMGTGSAIAHRAVDSFMGPRGGSSEPAPAPAAAAPAYAMPPAEGPCAGHVKAFAECMSRNNGEMSSCQFYFDMMQQCKLSPA